MTTQADEAGSVAGQLVSELEGEAEFIDHGRFDIDVDKALDKLARFQLADASTHVLRIAEAGVLLGAETIRFELDRRELRVRFEGPEPVAISRVGLERLFSVLVGSEQPAGPAELGAEREVLVQLAVAMLAAMRSTPLELSIESIAANREGYRRVFTGGARGTVRVSGEPGTRIYLLDPGRDVSGEREHLYARCKHALAEILVDGVCVSRQPILYGAQGRAPLRDDAGALIGELGFVPGGGPARMVIARAGIEIETQVLAGLTPGFLAWIDTPLPRDLSQSEIRRTQAYDELVEEIRAQHAELLPTYHAALAEHEAGESQGIARAKRTSMIGFCFAGIALFDAFAEEVHATFTVVTVLLGLCVGMASLCYAGVLASRRAGGGAAPTDSSPR